MFHNVRVILASSTALAALATAAPAIGQEAPGRANLEELVVTARRREESIQKVPVAVTALGSETLNRNVLENAQDLRKVVPGLITGAAGGGTGSRINAQFTIRGQGGSQLTGGSGVAAYFAEVPFTAIDFFDLQNVQVLKGPQGTLFGRVTTGGAVLVTPRAPTEGMEGYLRTRLSEYGGRMVEFGAGGPLLGDKLLVRLAGQHRASDGFTRNKFLNRWVDGYDIDTYRLTLRFKPTDTVSNSTILMMRTVADGYSRGQLGVVAPFGSVNPSTGVTTGTIRPVPASIAAAAGLACPVGICPTWVSVAQQVFARTQAEGPSVTYDNSNAVRAETRNYTVINTLEFQLAENLLLKNITSYDEQKTLNDGDVGNGIDLMFLPLHEGITVQGPGPRSVTEELQLQADFLDRRLQLTTGGYFEQAWSPIFSRVLSGQYAGFGNSVPVPGPGASAAQVAAYNSCVAGAPFNEVNSNYCHNYTGQTLLPAKTLNIDYAGFAQAQFRVSDQLRLTGGVRNTWSVRKSLSGSLLTNRLGLTNPTSPNTPLPDIATRLASVRGNPRPFAVPEALERLPGANVSYQKGTFSKATWMVAADYTVNNDLFLYGTIRTGYKPGGFNTSLGSNSKFGPETVTDYEVGAKATWSLGGVTGRTSLSIFNDKYSDIQRSVRIPLVVAGQNTFVSVIDNVASATIRGVDLETFARFSEWLDVKAYYSYTDAKYNEWPNTGQFISNGVPITADLTQNRVAMTVKHRWGIEPTVHLPGLPDAMGKVSLSANLYHQSSMATSDLNGPFIPFHIVPAYTKLDVRAELADLNNGPLSLAAGLTNATDKRNVQTTTDLRVANGLGLQQYADPRTWYLEATYRF